MNLFFEEACPLGRALFIDGKGVHAKFDGLIQFSGKNELFQFSVRFTTENF
jgi:hypothetical protein